jgi:predicted short-subunit dehydrogenase-like oxidoreductase (DUF2520 family)
MTRYRIIGLGKAGLSFDAALRGVGWNSAGLVGRGQPVNAAAQDVDVVVLAVPDEAIAPIAQAIDSGPAVVMHIAGSRTLDVLAPHQRVASLHPLISMPNPTVGAMRLTDGCRFAVAGHAIATDMAIALGGEAFPVSDTDRSAYHAGAAIASNHGVALWAQVERIAAKAHVPAEAYWQLMRTSLENAVASSAAEAITGPASRGDWETVRSHLEAIGEDEHDLYRSLAIEAALLADQTFPEELS